MSLEQIFFNDNMTSNESMIATELNSPRRLIPLTEELRHDKDWYVAPEILEKLNSLEDRVQAVENKIDRLHEICEECTQSVQVEYGSELTMSVASSLPGVGGEEEEREEQILRYISKEDCAKEGKKDVEVARSEASTDLYDRLQAEKRIREVNLERLRRANQFRDLKLNRAHTRSRCQRQIQEDVLRAMSRVEEEPEKICKFH